MFKLFKIELLPLNKNITPWNKLFGEILMDDMNEFIFKSNCTDEGIYIDCDFSLRKDDGCWIYLVGMPNTHQTEPSHIKNLVEQAGKQIDDFFIKNSKMFSIKINDRIFLKKSPNRFFTVLDTIELNDKTIQIKIEDIEPSSEVWENVLDVIHVESAKGGFYQ